MKGLNLEDGRVWIRGFLLLTSPRFPYKNVERIRGSMLGRSGFAEASGGIVYKKKVAFRSALFILLDIF